jgi:hypothetical protein
MQGLKETGLYARGVGIVNFEKPYFEHPYHLNGGWKDLFRIW